ncbi:MAG: hypothetical protein ACQEQJ_00770 [Halobacteriota archaeon]|uniref:Uncharacterized protein n=1 Tax=Halodesulfurarchaeum formicicum TaxID=1873524 RepID=A0A1D8S306_9EURY|nr:hypothetical protein [Halodesulfurarchaeum formicicum]AOW79736.1 hypothetical protein HTSR_0541 [Halodesulfurarchaeum formicicum]APE94987.1 hypothetical protein HSR6_0525 [Halodesulfurarchaeum formicicum]
MSDLPHSDDDTIASATDFERTLQAVLRSAYENDVPPAGSWVLRNGEQLPDWEVQVTELEKSR